MKVYFAVAAFLLSIFSTALSQTGSCPVSSSPRQTSVDNMGQANVDIPMDLPPGTAGMEPHLSFHYNSLGSQGHLGVGWTVAGLSAITRSPQTVAQDGSLRGIHLDNEDKFNLDGKRLVSTVGIYGASDSKYRTNPDEFSLITSYQIPPPGPYLPWRQGPSFFRVYTKDGLVMEYGGNLTSSQGRIEAFGIERPVGQDVPPPIRVWAVSKIYDRSGNYMTFEYGESQGDYWIEAIHYSGHGTVSYDAHGLPIDCSAGTLPYNHITFEYRTVTPYEQGFFAGAQVIMNRLLQKVHINAGGQTAYYDISNDGLLNQSAATRRHRVKGISRVDSTNHVLPLGILNYSDASATFLSQIQGTLHNGWGSGFGGLVTIKHEMFADQWSQTLIGGESSAWIHSAQGHVAVAPILGVQRVGTNGISVNAGFSLGPLSISFVWSKLKVNQTRLADFDGDGKTDAMQFTPNGEVYGFRSTGSQFASMGQWATGMGKYENSKFGDFNGDGRTDLLCFIPNQGAIVKIAKEDGSGFESGSPSGFWGMYFGNDKKFAQNVKLADVNGDGLTDAIYFANDPDPWHLPSANKTHPNVFLSNGTQFLGNGRWLSKNVLPAVDGVDFADVDGDGRADIIAHDARNKKIDIYLSTGTKFEWRQTIKIPDGTLSANDWLDKYSVVLIGDYNGDRLPDLLIFQPTHASSSPGTIVTPAKMFLATGEAHTSGGPVNAYHAYLEETSFDLTDSEGFHDLGGIGYNYQFVFRTGDFNGDGKTDLMRFKQDSNQTAQLFVASPTSFFSPLTWATGIGTIDEISIADPDGDGRSDVLRFVSTNIDASNRVDVYLASAFRFPDKLTDLYQANSPLLTFDYAPVSDDSIYLGHTPLTGYPAYSTRNQRGAWHVVKSMGTLTPQDSSIIQSVGYKGGKADLGHGFLGFAEISFYDPSTNFQTFRDYRQDFPFTGAIFQTLKYSTVVPFPAIPIDQEITDWSAVTSVPGFNIQFVRPDQSRRLLRDPDLAVKSDLKTLFTYDGYGNVLTEQQLTSDGFTSTTTTTYPNEDTASWRLGLPDLISVVGISGSTTQSSTILNSYDLPRRLLQDQTTNWTTDGTPRSLTKHYGHDSYGNTISETISGSDITTRTSHTYYDLRGQFPVEFANPLGHFWDPIYEPLYGKMTQLTDMNYQTIQANYDSWGRLIHILRPDGTSSNIDFCTIPPQNEIPQNYNRSITISSSGQANQRVDYDHWGRKIREVVEGFDGTPIFKDFHYDPQKPHLTTIQGPYYKNTPPAVIPTAQYFYDAIHRIHQAVTPTGAQYTYQYSGTPSLILNPLVTTLAKGGTIEENRNGVSKRKSVFDDRGQLIQVQEYNAANNSLIGLQTFRYDSLGNLIKTADINLNQTTITRDNLGRRISLNDPDTGLTQFTQNVLDEMVSTTDAKGQTRQLSYDLLGRVTQRTDPDGQFNWSYDQHWIGALDQVAGLLGTGYKEEYFYNPFGRLARTKDTILGNEYEVLFDYDNLNRLHKITYPIGTALEVQYQYNSRGYMDRVFDPNSGYDFWVLETMNAWGAPTQYHFGNGVYTDVTYPFNLQRPESIVSYYPPQAPFQNLAYSYDPLGRMTTRDFTWEGNSVQEQFSYNPSDELTQVIECVNGNCALKSSYSYSPLGNILTKSDTGVFSYSPTVRPHQPAVLNAGGTNYPFNYDLNGNMISGVGRNLSWDSHNRLTSVQIPGQYQANYLRNASRGKMVTDENFIQPFGIMRRTTYVRGLYEMVDEGTTHIDRSFIYAGSVKVAVKETGIGITPSIAHPHHDALGSPEHTSYLSGLPPTALRFEPFGQSVNGGVGPGNTGFTGHEHLPDAGLIDMNARVYDPFLAHFLSADPTIPDSTDPRSYNRYSYVSNNPLNLVDPTGYAGGPPDGRHDFTRDFSPSMPQSQMMSYVPYIDRSVPHQTNPEFKISIQISNPDMGSTSSPPQPSYRPAIIQSNAAPSIKLSGPEGPSEHHQEVEQSDGLPDHPFLLGLAWVLPGSERTYNYPASHQITQEIINSSEMADVYHHIAIRLDSIKYSPVHISAFSDSTQAIDLTPASSPPISLPYFNPLWEWNLTSFYLGSYKVVYKVHDIDYGLRMAVVDFKASNTSGLESFTHYPWFGEYRHILDNRTTPDGFFSNQYQTFRWSRVVTFRFGSGQ